MKCNEMPLKHNFSDREMNVKMVGNIHMASPLQI